jgi:hypothetical protein
MNPLAGVAQPFNLAAEKRKEPQGSLLRFHHSAQYSIIPAGHYSISPMLVK